MLSSASKHKRRSIRLPGYDYAQPGGYFITVCAHNRACIFGDIENGEIRLNDAGRMVQQCWAEIPDHYPHVTLDQFVVMPNHIHGIVIIQHGEAKTLAPLCKSGTSLTLGSIVRGFKIGVTKWAREYTDIYKVWHRNYYEHIIRNDDELHIIREYIQYNPQRWIDDDLHP